MPHWLWQSEPDSVQVARRPAACTRQVSSLYTECIVLLLPSRCHCYHYVCCSGVLNTVVFLEEAGGAPEGVRLVEVSMQQQSA